MHVHHVDLGHALDEGGQEGVSLYLSLTEDRLKWIRIAEVYSAASPGQILSVLRNNQV